MDKIFYKEHRRPNPSLLSRMPSGNVALLGDSDRCPVRSFSEAMRYAADHRFESIALSPLEIDNYSEVIRTCQSWTVEFPKQVSFYHINKGDFPQFYEIMS